MFDFLPTSPKKPKLSHHRSQSQRTARTSAHKVWAGREQSPWQDELEQPVPFRHQRHTHSGAQATLAPFQTHHSSQSPSPPPHFTEPSSESSSGQPSAPCQIELPSWIASATHRNQEDSAEESSPEILVDPWTNRPLSIGSVTGSSKIGTHRLRKKKSSRVVSEWFNGDSSPLRIGPVPSPTKEKADPMATLTSKPSLASRLSLFTSKNNVMRRPASPAELHDEFLDLDIPSAFSPVKPTEPLSPTTFKSLQVNAESLLTRMQTAYKERSIALRHLTAERDAEIEEREGTETRCQAFKVQLDDLAGRLKEQDDAMMDLVDQLANERRLRREEEQGRKRTITLVRNTKRERLSTATTASTCDSDDESSSESVFSRRLGASSPSMSMSSVSVMSSPEVHQPPELPAAITPQMARTYGGLASHPLAHAKSSTSCRKCHSPKDLEAWNVVSMLKEENSALKERISDMEGALDGCLNILG